MARTLIDSSVVWDNHGCMPLRPDDERFLPQLARYKAAGVDAVTLNVGYGDQGIEEHIRMIAHFRAWLARHRDDYVMVSSAHDIERARADGKLAVLFDIEGMNAVADQPSLVRLYYDLGVRWMLVAYNRNNPAGGGCQDDDTGLTGFGRRILDKMAEVGMVACCSHTGPRTAAEVMEYSSRPVLFSHSNARAVHDHPRNISDDLLRACARTGGVIGVNGLGLFVGTADTIVLGLVRHIDHIVQLVGIEHVGLGLDHVFDRAEIEELLSDTKIFPPELGYSGDFNQVAPEAIGDVVDELLRLGYSDEQLRLLLGGNLLRVANQVWR
ncbi:MAG: membrane dipeptidase [Pseudomonadota bacterium]